MLYNISLSYGQAWFRFGPEHDRLHIIRAPWCRPCFLERNGIEHVKAFMGWRYTYKVSPLDSRTSA